MSSSRKIILETSQITNNNIYKNEQRDKNVNASDERTAYCGPPPEIHQNSTKINNNANNNNNNKTWQQCPTEEKRLNPPHSRDAPRWGVMRKKVKATFTTNCITSEKKNCVSPHTETKS